MAGFFLGLFGFGKMIGKFVLDNWKIFLPILLVIAAYWYHKDAVSDAYDAGVVAEQQATQRLIDEQNERNRALEKLMGITIGTFNDRIAQENTERVTRENTHTETINNIIRENPVYEQCVVDQEIIDLRNETRALGPSGDSNNE